MYQEVFNFNSRPFTSNPYVNHYCAIGPVSESMEQIQQAMDRDAGPSVVVGQHGTGKSLLLELLADRHQDQYHVVPLTCGPMTERRDLLQAIMYQLEEPYRDLSEGELRLSLIDFIKPTKRCPNGILLLVDDAQSLSVDLVDELRLVTNFVRDGVPRVRLVMAGTSGLEELFTEPKLEPFNQRVSARCYLRNLNQEETRTYIHEHIARAGGDAAKMFERATTEAIHEATQGCPRFVNQLGEQTMIVAATRGMLVVEPEFVNVAWAQVQGLPVVSEVPVTETTVSVSDDEDWTVIEFGSLDDDECEALDETVETLDNTEPGVEFAETTGVSPDHKEAVEVIDNVEASGEEDAFQYQPPVHQDHLDEPAAESPQSIPTEIQSLYDDQQATWDAANVVDEPEVVAETANPFVDGDTDEPLQDSQENEHLLTGAATDEPLEADDSQTDSPQFETPTVEEELNQESISDAFSGNAVSGVVGDFGFSEMVSDSPVESPIESPAEPVVETLAEAGNELDAASHDDLQAANPFDETFEAEESIADGFAQTQMIADHNASSLEVRDDDLGYLQPLDPTAPSDAVNGGEVSALAAFGDAENIAQEYYIEPHSPETDFVSEPKLDQTASFSEATNGLAAYSAETDTEFGVADPAYQNEDSLIPDADAVPVAEHEVAQDDVAPEDTSYGDAVAGDEPSPVETVQQLSDETNQVAYDRLAEIMSSLGGTGDAVAGSDPDKGNASATLVEQADQFATSVEPTGDEASVDAVLTDADDAVVTVYPLNSPLSGAYHDHGEHAPTPDIQQAAEEILQSIESDDRSESGSELVSHETGMASHDLSSADAEHFSNEATQQSGDPELTDTQRILSEILEQKSLLSGQRVDVDDSAVSNNSQDDLPASLPMVQPGTDGVGVPSVGDGSDIIVVSGIADLGQSDSSSRSATGQPENQSLGRAKRMDYERLFEQLRNPTD